MCLFLKIIFSAYNKKMSDTTQTDIKPTSKPTPNKQKIRLIFPYEQNPEFKKLGVKWDMEQKIWYYPSLDGELPDNLKPFKCYKIAINYDDKEYFKPILKSMRWDKNLKVWIVNQEDYTKFINL